MAKKIGFKSYCWAIGTTSYRTDNFNLSIEKQLHLLRQFREIEENKNKKWENNKKFQAEYYNFLKENNFVKGEAALPDKDDERNITEAGLELLRIADSANFSADNFLEIPKDSFLYFKQMLKTANVVEGKIVRPFVVFLYAVNELGYLTNDEFTYLLPLCVDEHTTKNIVKSIKSYRGTGEKNFDDIILSVLMEKDNYKQALNLLKTEPISEELICNIGINRKSAKYDKPYYTLYSLLKKIVFSKDNLALEFYEATKKLTNSKVGGAWRKYFFNSSARSVISREGLSVLNTVPILQVTTEEQFNEEFFKVVHIFKARATLSDYFDLNRRYFKITDVVLFEDNKVKLDVLPQCYVEIIARNLLNIAFEQTELLPQNSMLKDVGSFFDIDINILYQKLGSALGTSVANKEMAQMVIKDERYTRFNKLIDDKFDKNTIIRLLDDFESRNDDEIRSIVTDNADIPTIFEYVLGIAWYIISERKGDVLEYMNLSLEATLADKKNQRRMEMEPVSRHLGDYCLAHPEDEAYCVFITTFLNNNVISDFRARRFMEYYNNAGTKYITGMKILPIQTTELKTLLRFDVKYPQIYKMLDAAYKTDGSPKEWYENSIVRETGMYNGQEI